MIDKQIRPLPKRLSKAQRAVLATYPNARCGTADAMKEDLKPFWDRCAGDGPNADIFANLGKTAKWVIYTEPSEERVKVLGNAIGMHATSQAKAWEDALNVMTTFMMWKLEN